MFGTSTFLFGRTVVDVAVEFDAEQVELGADIEDVGGGSGFVVEEVAHPEGPAMEAKRNLEAMRQQSAGAVTVRWTARGILLCLAFTQSLNPGAVLSCALADAAVLLFGPDGDWLARLLREGTLPMPGFGAMRQAGYG